MDKIKLPITDKQSGVDIARVVNRVVDGMFGWIYLEELVAAPPTNEIYKGMVVLADGTSWNPGAGQGVYAYYNSTWNKLG